MGSICWALKIPLSGERQASPRLSLRRLAWGLQAWSPLGLGHSQTGTGRQRPRTKPLSWESGLYPGPEGGAGNRKTRSACSVWMEVSRP